MTSHRQQGSDAQRVKIARRLWQLWFLNARIGWPERRRGLHYWLGFEYALAMENLVTAPGSTILDIGTGPHSIFPYAVAEFRQARVHAVDIAADFHLQRERHERAVAAGISNADQVRFVRADARQLSFTAESFDAFTAMSTFEHVRGIAGDREALQEAARVLRPGGTGIVTVPFRAEGSMQELDPNRELFQWHYSARTLQESLIGPSGLTEIARAYYGELLPFYDLARRLPDAVHWLVRPWDTPLTAAFIRVVERPDQASGVLVVLRKPDA